MDRMDEYSRLREELEQTPPALAYTVQRARARYRKSRVRRFCGLPVASLAGVFAAFVLLVNTSVPFAMACGGVPVLKELAAAVAFSSSLREAVEHDYVQYIGQKQTVEGLTMVIDYAIADKKQVNFFYHFEGEAGLSVYGIPRLAAPGGGALGPHATQGGGELAVGARELGQITADFVDTDVPGRMELTYQVERLRREDHSPATAAPEAVTGLPQEASGSVLFTFTFDISLDPAAISQGRVIEINQWMELEGQRVLVESAEIYPTHLRVNLADDPDNTAWLKSLRFYIEDETGRRNEAISNGISATGTTGTPFMGSMHQESTFFWQSEHLTLHITGAEWLDKDLENVKVDLNTGAHGWLPDGVGLTVERQADRACFTVKAPQLEQGHHYQVMSWEYLDPQGNPHTMDSRSSNTTGPLGEETPGFFYEEFSIPVHDWDYVWLKLTFTRRSSFDTPVSIPLS